MKKRLLASLLSICLLVGLFPLTVLAAGTDKAEYAKILYVDANGQADGTGTTEDPFQSLETAVAAADPNGRTLIYLMSDIGLNSIVSIWEKDVTIASDPVSMKANNGQAFTISRGDHFQTSSDLARGMYNPAMIEVGGTTGQGVVAYLRLENIVLDDQGKAQGGTDAEEKSYYIQAASDGDGNTDFGDLTTENNTPISNTDIVQDAIIATYNGTGEITLGSGTVLKNYGGMSAVRLSGGTLIMESGSTICDDASMNRVKGDVIPGADTGLYGPAGAIWMQGGTFIMENGSEIRDMVGRAIYNEAGNATINGTISGVTSSTAMWQNISGFVMHMRNSATATLSATGVIDGNSVSTSGNAVDVLGSCEFTAEYGSVIRNIATASAVNISGTAYLNGEITAVTNGGHAVIAQSSAFYVCIGETAYIHDNVSWYGVIYTQSNAGIIDIYGKINNNISTDRGGAIAMANNGTHVTVNMYEGAELCNNVSTQTGGGIMVSCGTFTMYGGTISGNISGADAVSEGDTSGGGVYVRRGGQFIMYDGVITNNISTGYGGGIAFAAGDYNNNVPYIQLNGGTISGNMMNAAVTGDTESGYTVSGGIPNDIAVSSSDSSKIDRYLSIRDDVVLGEESIYMAKDNFYLENLGGGVKFGNASTASENSLIAASEDKGWSGTALAVFWMQSDLAQELVFTNIDRTSYDSGLPIYALMMGTDADGTVLSGATAMVYAVTKNADGTMSLTIPATGENGCAIALVQPTSDYGTLTLEVNPDSIGSEDFENGSTTLSYTATYTLSENIRNQIGNTGQTFTLSIDFDDSLNFVADTFNVNGQAATATVGLDGMVEVTFQATEETDRVTITFDAKLDSEDFVAGGQLVTTGEVSATFSTGSVSTVVSVPSRAVITEMELYTIYATAEAGGSISPSGEVNVNQGGSITFTITPDSSYEIADVLVDSVSVGAISSYTFDNVTSNHTISAIFRSTGGSTGGNTGVTRYTITASAGEGGSISPSGSVQVRRGNDQIFTIEADEGYKISDVLVDGKSVGAVSSYIFENVQARHTIKAVFEEISTVTDPDDTGVSDWLNTDDHTAYLSGYPNNLFGPDCDMTRAEVAQMFYNLLLDKDVPITAAFDDVDSGAWYAEAVNTLASLGMINGVGSNCYEPERTITRAEFTAIAMRFTHLETDGENIFSDVHEDEWFYDIVVGSIQYGWICGYPDGTFRPYNTITRAEVITIVNRMLGRSADMEYVDSHVDSVRQFSDLKRVHWAYYDIVEATNGHTYRKDKGTESWTGLT